MVVWALILRQEQAEEMIDDAGAEGVAQFEEVDVVEEVLVVDGHLAVLVGAALVVVHEKQDRSQIWTGLFWFLVRPCKITLFP